MKDTYSVRELQRDTAGAVRAAESGALVTITRHERPVVHVISAARLGGMIETMELLADPKFMAQLKKLRAGKLKFYPLSSVED
ncbi:MAG: type II toxin-antitoxin system prevent-host-death family antitoxin [Opitutae bacterium]|nr:type II toxin-antitoxin system prevent-host-death family antitoxin [Opitutae bacterium]